MSMHRVCADCHKTKPTNEFPKPHTDGRKGIYCWPCTNYIEWATS